MADEIDFGRRNSAAVTGGAMPSAIRAVGFSIQVNST
jgi:hypothetical protein